LEPNDLIKPHLTPVIARTLCEMHHLEISTCKKGPKSTEKIPMMITKLKEWYDTACTVRFNEKDEKSKQSKLNALNLHLIGNEIETIMNKRVVKNVPSPIVFSHNDLLAGNILVRGDESNSKFELVFVDVEYSGYNYRGFDIGNHFCEYSGFDFNKFEETWPNKEQQYIFLNAYLEKDKEYRNSLAETGEMKESGDCGNTGVTIEEVEELYKEVNQYALGSHLFWGIWAVIQSKYSPIDFDYLEYAKGRFNGYYKAKDNVQVEFWS